MKKQFIYFHESSPFTEEQYRYLLNRKKNNNLPKTTVINLKKGEWLNWNSFNRLETPLK